jgi:uncharacterized protein YjeT (DUF2065 family)
MRGRVITATLLVAVGLVWVGQGLGLLRGSSFMVDDWRWAAAGLVAVVIGIVLAVSAWRSRRPEG